MVEKNSFLGDMMDKKASGEQPDAKVRAEDAAGDFYNSTEYTNIKYRLIEQRSQLIKMADYAQDTSIKLNDIYEIIKNMRLPQTEVERVDEDVSISALDLFFRENGYIPVKVLNNFQGQGGEYDFDFRNRRRRNRFGRNAAIIAGLLAALSGAYVLSGSDSEVSPEPEPTPGVIPETAPDLAPVAPPIMTAPDLLSPDIPYTGPDVITPGAMSAPITTPAPDLPDPIAIPDAKPAGSAPVDIPQPTAPDLPDPFTSIPIPSNDIPGPLMRALAGIMATLQMYSSRAAGSPPIGMGGARIRTRPFGGRGFFMVPSLDPFNVSIDENTEQQFSRKLILEASEITFEADRFDFIQKTLFAATEPGQLTNASAVTPPATGATGGSESTMATEPGSAPSGGGGSAVGAAASTVSNIASAMGAMGGPIGGMATALSAGVSAVTSIGRATGLMGDDNVTPGMGGAAMPDIPSGGSISQQDAYQLALGAGFNEEEARTMAAIAVAESGLNTTAFNGNASTGDKSYGLWQINMLGRMGPERRDMFGIQSDEQLFDPATNARAAYEIYKMQGFGAWSVYNSGRYRQYMNAELSTSSTTPSSAGLGPVEGASTNRTGATPTISSALSEFGDYLSGLSKDVTMGLETPTRPTTTPAVNINANINTPTSPAYNRVDEPMAAMDDMMKKLFDEVIFT